MNLKDKTEQELMAILKDCEELIRGIRQEKENRRERIRLDRLWADFYK